MHIVIDNLWISTRLPSCSMSAACEANKLLMRMVTRSMLCFTKLVAQALAVVNCVKNGTLVLEHKDEHDLGLHLLQLLRRLVPICYRMLCVTTSIIYPKSSPNFTATLSARYDQRFNYMQVIGSDKETSRLLLCEATAVVMRKCFNLLGITPIYKI
ncbi:hypothetical protein ES288_D11G211700v1 [Gossypium darwinii]|uniref:arginine--tRNA ligase n=1 Tax=Gossypium darwinii TaxID=34276 RepID=A0A5D2AN42_GOSDA|nr:hypothetical protein ES288_D11G211700v1 [Gossypium darwinii]